MNTSRGSLVLVGLLLSLFWAVSVRQLAVAPPVYEDEPWQASTGYKLAMEGVFGSDLFAGWYGMERHYYGYLPLHSFCLAIAFRLFGFGLFQARLVSVAMGLLILALTYALARRLFGPTRGAWIGGLAVAVLVVGRWTGTTPSQITGILLVDVARIVRYDIVVPVFGLAALHAYVSARRRRRLSRPVWPAYGLAGGLAGLAGLSHVYGVFWLPALLALAAWDGGWPAHGSTGTPAAECSTGRSRLGVAIALLVGFSVPWLPYVGYIVAGWSDFRGQTQGYADRFDLLSLMWYWVNLKNELRRYGPGLAGEWGDALRVGFWSAAIGLPLGGAALMRRGLTQRDEAARAVVTPLLVIGGLFAGLIHLKLVNYAVTLIPLAALALGWGWHRLWDVAVEQRRMWLRPILLLLLLGITLEGASRFIELETRAARTTPYAIYVEALQRYFPPNARVVGLHTYWLGLRDVEYTSFLVPVWWADPELGSQDIPLDSGLERLRPDIVLIDDQMRQYLAAAGPYDARAYAHRLAWEAWLAQPNVWLAGRVEDPTYGTVEIYRAAR